MKENIFQEVLVGQCAHSITDHAKLEGAVIKFI